MRGLVGSIERSLAPLVAFCALEHQRPRLAAVGASDRCRARPCPSTGRPARRRTRGRDWSGCTRTCAICRVASSPMRVHVFPASVLRYIAVAVRRRLPAHRVLAGARRTPRSGRTRRDGDRRRWSRSCGRRPSEMLRQLRRRSPSSTRRRRCSRRSTRAAAPARPPTASARPPRNGPMLRHCSARKGGVEPGGRGRGAGRQRAGGRGGARLRPGGGRNDCKGREREDRAAWGGERHVGGDGWWAVGGHSQYSARRRPQQATTSGATTSSTRTGRPGDGRRRGRGVHSPPHCLRPGGHDAPPRPAPDPRRAHPARRCEPASPPRTDSSGRQLALPAARPPRAHPTAHRVGPARTRATGSSAPTTASRPRSTPRAAQLRGRETIHYVNNSPHALPYLWLFVEQNICRATQHHRHAQPAAPHLRRHRLRFLLRRHGHGRRRARVGDDRGPADAAARSTARRCASTSRARSPRARRSTSTSPGASRSPTRASAAWAATARSTRSRSGTRAWRCTTTCKGWNTEPYIGAGEFYLEYGSFDVALTVPAGYTVAATGELRNPEQVLSASAARAARRGPRAPTPPSPSSRAPRRATRALAAGRAGDGLALHRRQRARLRLGRRAELDLGGERLERHPRADAVSPVGERMERRRGAPHGARRAPALQRAVVSLPVPAHDHGGGTGGRDGVPDAHLRAERLVARDDALGARARARARVVPDDRRLQ